MPAILTLWAPDGAEIGQCDTTFASCLIDNVTLTSTGLLTVAVDASSSAPATHAPPPTRLDVGERTIDFDQTVEDGIDPLGDQDVFAFTGAAGQHVTASLVEKSFSNSGFAERLLLLRTKSRMCNN